jgi:four helix bundle protein
MNADELKNRTKECAARVVKFVENLERGKATDIIGKQLIRSATSVAANYGVAYRSRSRADFANKLGIVEGEADETPFWFEMLIACNKVEQDDVHPLMDEVEQLLKIFSASHVTAKRNRYLK